MNYDCLVHVTLYSMAYQAILLLIYRQIAAWPTIKRTITVLIWPPILFSGLYWYMLGSSSRYIGTAAEMKAVAYQYSFQTFGKILLGNFLFSFLFVFVLYFFTEHYDSP